MRIIRLGLSTAAEFSARKSIAVLLLILLAVGFFSALHALAQPFWYDEICTVILCRLPSASEIWKALDNAADTNPPIFYFVARLTRKLVSDDHLGYRLPSILGLLGTVFCIYLILSRRVDQLSALVGATFVLCTPLAAYAYEARPYALMVGCISGAILAWQRIDDARLYSLVLAITLAAAVSLHYYAIFVWPAFFAAETSVLIFHRRFRVSAWVSLVVGALPLIFFANLLTKLRQYYGQNFWAHSSFLQVFVTRNWLLNFPDYSVWTFAAGVTVISLYLCIPKADVPSWLINRQVEGSVLPIEEQALTLMLLGLPMIVVAAGKVSHIGMADRYMLPTVLGGALVLGYLIRKAPSAVRVLLLIVLLMSYAISSINVVQSVLNGSLLESRETATREVKTIVAQHPESDLPIVISSGIRYLPMAYYAPADANRKLYAVTDPRTAIAFTRDKSDSVDRALLVLRRYFPLQVEDYSDFVSTHREFLLVSDPGEFYDWWPARLTHDGHTLRLLSAGTTTVYEVTLEH